MNIATVVLEGPRVRLEPLTSNYVEAFASAALSAPAELWKHIPYRVACRDDVTTLAKQALALQAAQTGVSFVTRVRDTGEIAGGTVIFCVDAVHRRAEIGFTWLLPRWQRTYVNTEAKYLQLSHCFDALRCLRVELKTDAMNARSRAAIARIGAAEEGTLRRHMVGWDGRVRDSTMFSVVDTAWPATKAHLQKLLTATGGEISA